MTTPKFNLAELSAIIAKNTQHSVYACADFAQKLNSLSASIVRVGGYGCNGFDTPYTDNMFSQYARENNHAAANALRAKLNAECDAYCTKRKAQLTKKLEKLQAELGLQITDKGYFGCMLTLPNGNEYHF